MGRIAALTRNPAMIALIAMLAITGCASKKTPNNAADLGLNGAGAATPGSAQDFTVNIGDRIFFDVTFTASGEGVIYTLPRKMSSRLFMGVFIVSLSFLKRSIIIISILNGTNLAPARCMLRC